MMNELHLSENIAGLRREKKITQEELADFLGVTKAAVSKWENGQTMPDILLLPQLAGFFGVTVDALLGYEAQLSREQIRHRYLELCGDFAKLPFSEVMERARSLVHRYYACYPFLLQICVLYLNHFMLAEQKEEGKQILKEGVELCGRILEECRDVGVCQDASALKAAFLLYLGRGEEVLELLEPVLDLSCIFWQSGPVLLRAYCMTGRMEPAKSCAQMMQYRDLVNLVGGAVQLLALHEAEPGRCREIMRRIEGVMELYQVETLHPNLAAQYHYQAALACMACQEQEKALKFLESFGRCVEALLASERIRLHGDSYFDRLDEWIDRLPLGDLAPRDRKFAGENALMALSHPAFSQLGDNLRFQAVRDIFLKGRDFIKE